MHWLCMSKCSKPFADYFRTFYSHQWNIGGHVQWTRPFHNKHWIDTKSFDLISWSSSEEIVRYSSCPETISTERTAPAYPRHERAWDSSTSFWGTELEHWHRRFLRLPVKSAVVRKHLCARAGAAWKATEIRGWSRPPGRSRLQSNLCTLPRTGLNQILREGGFLERYCRSLSGPGIDFWATLG